MLSGYMLLDDQEFTSHFVSHLLIYIYRLQMTWSHILLWSAFWAPFASGFQNGKQSKVRISSRLRLKRLPLESRCMHVSSLIVVIFFIIKFDYAFLNLFCLILNRLEQINIATKGHLGWKLAMSFSELAWIWKRGFRRFVSSHICITCIPCVFYITIKLSWFFRSITLQVSLPFLVLHGEQDKVTDQSASKELFEVASSKDKDLKLYPGMWHGLLYGEPLENINIVFRDIINWLDKRVSSGNSEM